MKKVVKFGGSSLASAEQFRKVGEIIHADENRKYVVPSAPGKRYDGDTKVTDMLYGCYDLAEKDHDFMKEMTQIEKRYQEIIDGLNLDLDLTKEFDTIIDNFKKKAGTNYAASRGSKQLLILWHSIRMRSWRQQQMKLLILCVRRSLRMGIWTLTILSMVWISPLPI